MDITQTPGFVGGRWTRALAVAWLVVAIAAGALAQTTDPDQLPAPAVPPGFQVIPAGTFTMGSPPDEPGRGIDETQREVTLTRAFLLGAHPVTEAQWNEVMGGGRTSLMPQVEVTWFAALTFCNKLSMREGLTPAYIGSGTEWTWDQDADGYRLPTEAEWEYACRAGSPTAFAGGPITHTGCEDPHLDKMGWYCGNSDGERQPVGQKAANAWGLHDMHGNVWEWCWDRWEDLQPAPVIDPAGPLRGQYRLARGGSFYDGAQNCRCARRANFLLPSTAKDDLGFRLARWAE